MSALLQDAYVLIADHRFTQVKELLPILEGVSQKGKSLLIIAEDVDGEALATLIVNKMRGTLKVCAVKAPDFGDRRTAILEDIATLTGGTVVSNDKGMTLAKLDITWLGKSRVVTVSKDVTTIVDGKGNIDKIEERILNIKAQMDKPDTTPYEIEKYQERLGKMVGGVAIINVGGGNEIEIDEKKDRIDDALQATKAALEEGIVPGAGMALVDAKFSITNRDKTDFGKGKQIVFQSCNTPLKQILSNAGESYSEWYLKLLKVTDSKSVPNINSGEMVDAFESGIIDPTKVVRCALENAAAAAITLLMTECVINEKPDEKKDDMGGMAGLGM